MSYLDDIFQSLTGAGGPVASSMQSISAVDPGQSTAPGGQTSTPLSELIVRGQAPKVSGGDSSVNTATMPSADLQTQQSPAMSGPPPSVNPTTPSPLDYDNKSSVDAVTAANAANTPQGGSANPGLYGILPGNLQHGVLRNVLGALGDAFLVQGGGTPEYANHMGRQQIGDAMAGMDQNDPASVAAATQRMAATGANGAMADSDTVQKNANDNALRQATLANTQAYRDSVMADRTQYHQQEAEARNQTILRQRGQTYSGQAISATTAAQYKALYDRADASAKQLDPKYSAEDMGMIRPEEWTPGSMVGAGMTGNNVVQHQDRQSGQATTRRGQDIGAGARVASARIMASSRPTSEAQYDEKLANEYSTEQSGGAPMPAGDRDAFIRRNSLPANVRPLSAGPTNSSVPPVTRQAMSVLGPGATNGGGRAPSGSDISYLRSHPEMRAQFDAHFGPGSSAKILRK